MSTPNTGRANLVPTKGMVRFRSLVSVCKLDAGAKIEKSSKVLKYLVGGAEAPPEAP